MNQEEIIIREKEKVYFEKEMSELLKEQIPFTENVFARIPMGIEIYDVKGILRSINVQAQQIYGVEDEGKVIDKINLFDSPYVDEALKAKIQSGEDIVLEFEYDFDRMNKEYFSTRNQNSIIYEVKIAPIRNKDEAIVGYMLLTNDVTETKEAKSYRRE